MNVMLETCKIEAKDPGNPNGPKIKVPAFEHYYAVSRARRIGMFRSSTELYEALVSGEGMNLTWSTRFLPMLVPPQKWKTIDNGGYLNLETKILRNRGMSWQLHCARRAKNMSEV